MTAKKKLQKEYISTPKGVYTKITQKEIEILNIFSKNPLKKMDFKGIREEIGGKSNRGLFNSLKKLELSNILYVETVGKSKRYFINLYNNVSLGLLAYVETAKAGNIGRIPHKLLNTILGGIENPFAIILITGSYAEGRENRNSDLDVAAIIPDSEDKRIIHNYLKNTGALTTPEIHPYVFNASEFYSMLINKEENYGKEIFRKRIILTGAEIYYKIIRRAIENGFKG